MKELIQNIQSNQHLFGFILSVLFGIFTFLIVEFISRLLIFGILKKRENIQTIIKKSGILRNLSFIFSAIVIVLLMKFFQIEWKIELTERTVDLARAFRKILDLFIIFTFFLLINRSLNAIAIIYSLYPISKGKPIKGYIQLLKIFLFIIAAIFSYSYIFHKSPWGLLSGVGALSAALMFVFKDTLVSFMASIQIGAHNIISLGDWIEMPEYSADGTVLGINLHNVVIQNWDKTIVAIPIYKMIEGSFKNYRGMETAGGRRIKRSIFINQKSIRFCDEKILHQLKNFNCLTEFLEKKETSVNLNIFRIYLYNYLKNHPEIRNDMTLIVRYLDPTPHGVPLEIYAFSKLTEWEKFEEVQASIFDHIYGTINAFGLKIFQSPSGEDFKS